jgi:hypothetical protein
MKSVFSICKVFCLLFFIVFTFSSCHPYLIIDGVEHPKNVTIYVVSYNPVSGYLNLQDDSAKPADPFRAWPGQKIRWKLSDPGHHKFDQILPKGNNLNAIFEVEPHSVWLSKSWKGTIKGQFALQLNAVKDSLGFQDYDYKIVWESAGTQHTDDPRIQIKQP